MRMINSQFPKVLTTKKELKLMQLTYLEVKTTLFI